MRKGPLCLVPMILQLGTSHGSAKKGSSLSSRDPDLALVVTVVTYALQA